jgi:uncharacterized LabA/DUF88 family protein
MQQLADRVEQLATNLAPPASPVYACLVDAENTQPAKLEAVCAELNGYGEVVVRRVYGDFSKPNLVPWKAVSNQLSFRPTTQFAIVDGKGTSDMILAMDAIDLIHDSTLKIDGFALVSSDSDFTPLAARLREGELQTLDP